jgi:hypothetical protein
MSIKGYVDELEQVQNEIKHNNARNKILRQRVKELQDNITGYLTEKGQPGLKYRGRAILLESKEKRPVKKKKEKEADVISLLGKLGVFEPEQAYAQLMDIQRGAPVEQQQIKFKKLPKVSAI